jgi:rifampicin phosphotransferase
MTSAQPRIDLPFETPGPGTWELDTVHFPRPATRYWAEMHPEPFQRGVAEFCRYYGMLLGSMQMAYVNGFAYRALMPVGDDEVPERFQRAEQVFEQKLWREQLREWDEEAKPAAVKTHRELQSVDPDALSDLELVEYLTRCRDHHVRMVYQHMRFTGAAMLSVGDLLAHLTDWTGVPPSEVLGMMRGAAPVSAGASSELDRMINAFGADASARQILESDGDPAQILDELRSLNNDVSRELTNYLYLVGCRLLDGFDISGRYALELPDALLRAIRSSVQKKAGPVADVDARIADIRSQVPEQHRAQFDELLGEARLMYRIRDERGVYSDIWASGIARRAVLGAGRRLAGKGRIDDPEHLVDAGFDEMVSMLSGSGGPSGEELAAHLPHRQGGPTDAGAAPFAPARPFGPAPGRGAGHAGDPGCDGRALRQL